MGMFNLKKFKNLFERWKTAVCFVETPSSGGILVRSRRYNASAFTNQNKEYAGFLIGDWTYGKPIIYRWNDETKLKIGKFCSIAAGVKIILGGEHRTDLVSTYPFSVLFEAARGVDGHQVTKGDVMIGNDVWIGSHAMILSGVTIGDGAVVGAGSVVCKDVAPYSIVAGNPARQIRLRLDEATIQALLKIAWWNWPLAKIEDALPLLCSGDVKLFIDRYG
jgi:acetyltransferase-like isoleucine patch superfamily enzyme